ncbi:hypothetical protein IP70_13165 [alpha proteobacterium AAP38]|nr:hypothetical protein IP70_13165 [alpha proteobacterium AAP38]
MAACLDAGKYLLNIRMTRINVMAAIAGLINQPIEAAFNRSDCQRLPCGRAGLTGQSGEIETD